jgi:hypothetical protein
VAFVTGCDQGSPYLSPSQGPPLRIIATYPALGAGLDCDPRDIECGVPIDARFEFRFDRFLSPDSAIRQSLTIYTGVPSNVVSAGNRLPEIAPEYDVVERVARVTLPEGLRLHPNAVYTLELAVPDADSAFGFAAFDGAPLAAETPLVVSFATSNQLEAERTEPSAPSCDEVVELFSGCASGACHGGATPRMGLDLSSPEAISRTAIGRVAHQTEVSSTTGVALQDPDRFGVAMPLIDPARPDNSYLLYKLLLADDNYFGAGSECRSEHLAAVDPELCTRPSADELLRIREGFVLGESMPHPASVRRLGPEGLRSVSRFIRAGAACP